MKHYFRETWRLMLLEFCYKLYIMRHYYFRETVRMCDVLCGKDKCLSRLTHPPSTLHSLHTLSQTRIIISIYKCAFVFATVALKYCHYLDDHKDFAKMGHRTRRGWVRVWSWAVSQFCKIYTDQFINPNVFLWSCFGFSWNTKIKCKMNQFINPNVFACMF